MTQYTTVFGSLDDYDKGRVDVINDDPKYYAFSNVFEVANNVRTVREGRRRQEPRVRDRGHPRRGRRAAGEPPRTTSSRW